MSEREQDTQHTQREREQMEMEMEKYLSINFSKNCTTTKTFLLLNYILIAFYFHSFFICFFGWFLI